MLLNVSKSTIRMKRIISLVHDYLNEIGVSVPFFVAGGSIYSSLNNSEYSDIDVYFYNKQDCFSVVNRLNELHPKKKYKPTITQHVDIHESNNSISINHGGVRFQFVKLHSGKPFEIFKKFDINCSKCCMTSDFKFIKDQSWTKHLSVDFSNIKTDILYRIFKYHFNKKIKNNGCIEEVISYILMNKDRIFKSSYNGGTAQSGLEIIKNAIKTVNFGNSISDAIYCYTQEIYRYTDFIHDEVVRLYSGYDRLEIFKEINIPYLKESESCDEHIVSNLLKDKLNKNKLSSREIKACLKYPEQFI